MLANVFTKTTRDRWKGVAIGVAALAAMLFFGMSVYRDIDLSVYTSLPEVFRTLMDIPANADVGSLAYGAIYGSYGTLTMAALALSMGSSSIAGEERKGTMGLLLGNPKSRTTSRPAVCTWVHSCSTCASSPSSLASSQWRSVRGRVAPVWHRA